MSNDETDTTAEEFDAMWNEGKTEKLAKENEVLRWLLAEAKWEAGERYWDGWNDGQESAWDEVENG